MMCVNDATVKNVACLVILISRFDEQDGPQGHKEPVSANQN